MNDLSNDYSKNDKKLCKSDLKDLGFSESMIEKLLPEPQRKRTSMGRYALLWDSNVVSAVMETNEFKSLHEKHLSRKQVAYNAVETKREKSFEWLEGKIREIKVTRIDINLLEDLAIEFQQFRNSHKDYVITKDFIPRDVMERWCVNYIRHNLTEYDDTLFDSKDKVGASVIRNEYRQSLFKKIKAVYPEFADECDKQAYR